MRPNILYSLMADGEMKMGLELTPETSGAWLMKFTAA